MTDVRPTSPIIAVRVAQPGLAQDARATAMVWRRELMSTWSNRIRLVAMLVQPLLFLFVLGAGLSSITASSTDGVSYKTFLFPGVLATSTLFTAMFAAVSVVWDREFGFLREMMVAPVSRTAIILGKALGGATIATLQGTIIILLAPLNGVPLSITLVVRLIVEVFVISFAITSFGLVLAARIKQMQAVMGVMQMIVAPMMMISGALYPITNLPAWLNVLVHLNPLSYGVFAVRSTVFSSLDPKTQAALAPLNPAMSVFGWNITPVVALGFVALIGVTLLTVAAIEFRRAE